MKLERDPVRQTITLSSGLINNLSLSFEELTCPNTIKPVSKDKSSQILDK